MRPACSSCELKSYQFSKLPDLVLLIHKSNLNFLYLSSKNTYFYQEKKIHNVPQIIKIKTKISDLSIKVVF